MGLQDVIWCGCACCTCRRLAAIAGLTCNLMRSTGRVGKCAVVGRCRWQMVQLRASGHGVVEPWGWVCSVKDHCDGLHWALCLS